MPNRSFRRAKKNILARSSFKHDIGQMVDEEKEDCEYFGDDSDYFTLRHEEGDEPSNHHPILLQDFISPVKVKSSSSTKEGNADSFRCLVYYNEKKQETVRLSQTTFEQPLMNEGTEIQDGDRHEDSYVCKRLELLDMSFEMKEKLRNEVKISHRNVHFSRMGSNLSGSISVVCERSRMAMLLLWSVKPRNDHNKCSYNIQAVPIVNCTRHELEALVDIAKFIALQCTKRFQSHYNGDTANWTSSEEAVDLYAELSRFIISSETKIIGTLSDRIHALNSIVKSHDSTIQRSLQSSTIMPGHSLDHIDIYSEAEQAEMNTILRAEGGVGCRLHEEEKEEVNDEHCPICFDSFNGDEFNLAACGHKACASCWRGLLQSAASSGDAIVKCPYFRCSNIIGIRDIAHILFDELKATSKNTDILSAVRVLTSLMRFRMEQRLVTSGSQNEKNSENVSFRFCPTPSCQRFFSFKTEEDAEEERALKGSNIYLCACGVSVCANCSHKGPSHLGLTCTEYMQLRKEVDSGRADSEFKSLQWMKSNTQACPKCKFPINKNGGCNHIWCSSCQYYFCWVCKGPGNICGSYKCNGNRNRGDEHNVRDSVMNNAYQLHNQIDRIMDFFTTEMRYQDMLKKGVLGNDDKVVVLEVQLCQALVWVQAYLAVDSSSKKKQSVSYLSNAAAKLKQILDVMSISDDDTTLKKVQSLLDEGNFHQGMEIVRSFSSLRNVKSPLPSNSNKALMTLRARQAKDTIEKKKRDRESSLFHSQDNHSFTDIVHVSQLCSMSPKRFNFNARTEIVRAIENLVNASHDRKRIDENENSNTSPLKLCVLNEKAKPLQVPWRKSRSPSTSDGNADIDAGQTIGEEDHVEGDPYTKRLRKQKWKGKGRIKARRTIALAKLADTIGI